jgi:hypothetical protein
VDIRDIDCLLIVLAAAGMMGLAPAAAATGTYTEDKGLFRKASGADAGNTYFLRTSSGPSGTLSKGYPIEEIQRERWRKSRSRRLFA